MRTVVLLLGQLAFAASLAAQADTIRPLSAVRVLTHSFTAPSREFVRVALTAGETYRAELDAGRAKLEILPRDVAAPRPVVREVLAGRDTSEVAIYDIEPRASGEYEIRLYSTGDLTVRLTLDRRPKRRT